MAAERAPKFTLAIEPETAFATDPTGGRQVLPIMGEVTATLKQTELEDTTVRIDAGENPPIIGPKAESTVEFDIGCIGLGGTPITGAAGGTSTALGEAMKATIGPETIGGGSTIATGHISAPVVATGHGSRFNLAGAETLAGFVTPNNGTLWRHIDTVSTDTLNLSYALPEAPATSAIVYGTHTFTWDDDIAWVTQDTSVLFDLHKERSDSCYTLLGCMADTFKVEAGAPGEVPKMTFGFKMADWVDTLSQSLSNPTVTTRTPWMNVQAEIIPHGSYPIAYNADYRRKLRTLSISMERGLIPNPDPHSTQGVCGWESGSGPMFTLDAEINLDDAWRDAFSAGTQYQGIFTFGNTAGTTVILWFRQMHLKAYPVDGSADGRLTSSLSFGVTAGATAPFMLAALG